MFFSGFVILFNAMRRLLKRNSIKTEILGIFFISLLTVTSILGYLSFQFSKNRLISMLADKSKAIASTAADFINSEDLIIIKKNIDGLKERRKEALSPKIAPVYESAQEVVNEPLLIAMEKYLHYMSLLSNVKQAQHIESPIKIYYEEQGRLILLLSTENSLSIGAAYEMRAEIDTALKNNMPEASGIYHDKDGAWISAAAPIGAPGRQNPEAVLVVDNKIDLYFEKLRNELVVIIITCIIGFLGAAALGYKLVQRIINAVKKLDRMAGNIEKENYNTKIEIDSNDEIGRLAETFERLRLSIRKKIDELKLSLIKEKKAHLDSIIALSNAIEVRDPYTRRHLYRVERYALLTAKTMKLPKDEIEKLRYGCYLHDIGKIYVDDSIFKKANLSEAETEKFKQHSQNGVKIIEGIPFLQKVKDIILYHQEKYDGSGYPEGLKGKEIPLLARIVAVADSFDAMTTDRPYKPKMSFSAAIKAMEEASGTQFDPVVVKAFLKHRDRIESIAKKHFQLT